MLWGHGPRGQPEGLTWSWQSWMGGRMSKTSVSVWGSAPWGWWAPGKSWKTRGTRYGGTQSTWPTRATTPLLQPGVAVQRWAVLQAGGVQLKAWQETESGPLVGTREAVAAAGRPCFGSLRAECATKLWSELTAIHCEPFNAAVLFK